MIELPLPSELRADNGARELVRVWATQGKQVVVLATGLWKDPALWGICLADLARHAAKPYGYPSAEEEQEAAESIRRAFEVEWAHPSAD